MKTSSVCFITAVLFAVSAMPGLAQKGRQGRGGPQAGAQVRNDNPVGLARARTVGEGKKKGLPRAEQNQVRNDARKQFHQQQVERRKEFQRAQRAEREQFEREIAGLSGEERKAREREFHARQKAAYKDFKEQEKQASKDFKD